MTEIIDLRSRAEQYKKEAYAQKGLQKTNGKFSTGDVIEFWSGYNDDIRYRAEVAGVVKQDIYIVWDCFWSPIQDNETTKIKLAA